MLSAGVGVPAHFALSRFSSVYRVVPLPLKALGELDSVHQLPSIRNKATESARLSEVRADCLISAYQATPLCPS